jgi:hypothetical protein
MGGAMLMIWLQRIGALTGSPPDWEVMIEHVTVSRAVPGRFIENPNALI